jgi:AraC family transcriptional regulator
MTDDAKLLTIYHNSFKITHEDKMRMSAGIILNQTVNADGEIGLTSIQECKCIVGHFEITVEEFERSWTGLFVWMKENGYEKSDQDAFEIYHNNFNEHPQKKASLATVFNDRSSLR